MIEDAGLIVDSCIPRPDWLSPSCPSLNVPPRPSRLPPPTRRYATLPTRDVTGRRGGITSAGSWSLCTCPTDDRLATLIGRHGGATQVLDGLG